MSDSVGSSARRAALLLFVGTRVPVLLIGALAVLLVGTIPPIHNAAAWRIAQNELLNLPARWDAFWYHTIATSGYRWDPASASHQNVVFFPLYPLLMRWVGAAIGGHPMAAGLLISLAAFSVATALLYRLAALELKPSAAWPAVLLLATYPFALYYSAVYTESLYLCAVAAAFYALRRRRFAWAGVAGLAAGLTRPNGIWLSVSLALRWFELDRAAERPGTRGARAAGYAISMLPLVGVALYSAYLSVRFGDALAWVHGQAAWGLPLFGRPHTIEPGEFGVTATTATDVLTWTGNILAFVLALAASVPISRRFGFSYASLIVLTLVPPVATHLFTSIGRFSATAFPLFFWMAETLPRKSVHRLAGAFAVFQAILAALFFLWRPVL